MRELSFKSILLYTRIKIHNFIQGDINKYTLHMFCYSKVFQKVFCKSSVFFSEKKDKWLSWFLAKVTNFIPIWKVSWNNPTLFEDISMIMIIFLHINTPCIKQHCFICSSPCSTNSVMLVQTTIRRYHMCKVYKLSNVQFLHYIHFNSSCFPQFYVQSYGRLIQRGLINRLHPTTLYIFDV